MSFGLDGVPQVLITPAAFNLGGAVMVPHANGGNLIENQAGPLELVSKVHRAVDYISYGNSYFLPWTVQSGDVSVHAKVPLRSRFLGLKPKWKEVEASHAQGQNFSVRWAEDTRLLSARTFVEGYDHKGDKNLVSQRTELTFKRNGIDIESGVNRLSVLGGVDLVNALIKGEKIFVERNMTNAGESSMAALLLASKASGAPLSSRSELPIAVLPLADLLLKGAEGRQWVLEEEGKVTQLEVRNGRFLRPNGARLGVPDKGKSFPVPFTVRTADGNMGVEFFFRDKGLQGDPLPYPAGDERGIWIWQYNPMRPDGKFSPFTPEMGIVAKTAAQSVFANRKIGFVG